MKFGHHLSRLDYKIQIKGLFFMKHCWVYNIWTCSSTCCGFETCCAFVIAYNYRQNIVL